MMDKKQAEVLEAGRILADQDKMIALMRESAEKNSMLYWWPRVRDRDRFIRMPRTIIVEVPHEILRGLIWQEEGAAGNWVFIDAALARDSYHPPECAHAKDWKRLYG